VRELFLLDPELVFLNHGSFGACPRVVFDEYQRFQREIERNPVDALSLYRRFPDAIQRVRDRLAAYVGARADDLILVPNATTGVNIVARSLDLRPGDEIVATTHEYGGNDVLWQWVCDRAGARYVTVDTTPAHAVDDLLGAVTDRTRLLFLSHVSSPTALVFPVEAICAAARDAAVPVLVDGAHAPGQMDLDLEAMGADWYTGNCHKWLCAPKGAGFLHARTERQAELEPVAVSWDWTLAPWADRHRWLGTRDPSAELAVPAAIEFQEAHAWPEVRARCHELAATARNELSALFGTQPFAQHDGEFLQMVSVRLPECDPYALGMQLFAEHRIEVLAQEWRGQNLLRVSFQGYNDESDLEALLGALRRERIAA
jgi:isopenicillin-N epimerase